MHPNPAFRHESAERNAAFARERGFGMLAVAPKGAQVAAPKGAQVAAQNGPPLLSHIPFLLNADGTKAELHLVRSNPICKALPAAARIAITGPDSYISPDWYETADQVPTWNYIAVHLTGRLEPLPEAGLHDLLERQSAHFEERLAPKAPWKTDKMSEGVMERMMRAIRPFVLHVEEITGTWKLNQNKEPAARLSAADHVEAYGQGSELAMLAALMRGA
ncbi:FMN-binding negative transcriptional regulator [Primorskyibacter sp. S187A]|uniref:FMN-binding negative transcriptional regulator n=1 Tax=Primorskyibacter sp. S187A TaxID=3415130 RepID=UPI003C798365